MSDLKPLPCPFCGGINIINCGLHKYCHSCGAEGPDADNGTDAGLLSAWNRRAQPAQAGQVLTDDRLLAMWEGTDGERSLRPTLGKNKILSFARAIEAAVLAKQVPMTGAQIEHALRSEPMVDNEESFALGIRHAERHHGIVGKEGA